MKEIVIPEASDITIGTPCISCGKTIDLGHDSSALVPRMCDECKEAIEFARTIIQVSKNYQRCVT